MFNFAKFIEDSKNVLLKPAEYFTNMPKTGGLGEPIIKALIYGLIAGILNFVWVMLKLDATSAVLGGAFATTAGIGVLFMSVIFAVIGLFIGGVIILAISAICSGTTDFEANVRVAAALAIFSPINALFGFTPSISFYLTSLVSLLVTLYAMYLLFIALTKSLTGSESTAKIITIVLAVLVALSYAGQMACMRTADTLGKSLGKKIGQQGEVTDAQKEEMEKALKKLQEALKEKQ